MANRVAIVGGVAAGMSAAGKAKRENPALSVTVFEQGNWVSYAACGLPYLIQGQVNSPQALLARTPEQFARQGIDLKLNSRVEAIDLAARSLLYRDVNGEHGFEFDDLVLAPGAEPVRPQFQGGELKGVHTVRSIEDALKLSSELAEVRQAVIVGAGYLGLEFAEAFRALDKEVTVIERAERVFPAADPEVSAWVHSALESAGVRVWTGTSVQGFLGSEQLQAVASDQGEVPAQIALLALGIRPNTRLAREIGLDLGPTGAVRVNPRQETSQAGVWAAGDVAESIHLLTQEPFWFPMGDVANKQGRVAGANIAGVPARFAGVVGTAITKAFSLGVALTGLGEAKARSAGFKPQSVVIEAKDRASYYPGVEPILVKLIYQKGSQKILGAQIAGSPLATKRIDVIAALIQAGRTVVDLAELDLAYAPPFAPVWDPLLVAANQV